MEADSQDHLPQHYILLDRYYIGRVLGQGGFGVTYLARDLRLDRVVAIKEYLPRDQCSRGSDHVTVRSYSGEKSDEFRYGLTTFLNEARNLSRLAGHPNIVSILDFAEANGTAYMVMEYIPGITLKKYLSDQGGVIPYGMAKEILLHVMAGLARTHEAGLIHRDVSPDNIVISSHGPVKLIDFGAARQAIGEKSQNLTMVLKPGYAPEEQYRSKGVQGAWTDVYATAATMYRCITGQVPPPAPDRMAEDELVPPGRLCRDLSPSVEAAILQGLSVRAVQRPQTIKDFQQPFTTPPPPPAPPPTCEKQTDVIAGKPDSAPVKAKVRLGNSLKVTLGVALKVALGLVVTGLLIYAVIFYFMYSQEQDAEKWWKQGKQLDNQKRYTEAAQLYNKACTAGNMKGCAHLGVLYANGTGVFKNKNRAVSLFQMACDAGDMFGCAQLGFSYQFGQGVQIDFGKAFSLSQRACNAGEMRGCVGLGLLYLRGFGATKDYEEAISLFQKACDAGEMRGCVGLGAQYQGGLGVTKNYSKALSFTQKACDGGLMSGCVVLGEMYDLGDISSGVRVDHGKAFRIYKSACDGGEANGCTDLGADYLRGQGVAKNYDQALSVLQKGCDGGDAQGCFKIGVMYARALGVKQDYGQAGTFFKKACDSDIPTMDICNAVGEEFDDPGSMKRDYSLARTYYQKACDGENMTACKSLSFLYLDGKGGEKNVEQYISYAKKACEGGDAESCDDLGWKYFKGIGEIGRDYGQARVLLEKACDGGFLGACMGVGSIYAAGLGVPKDDAQATKYQQKAIAGMNKRHSH